MPSTVNCPNPVCGRASHFPDEMVGRSARCKFCGSTMVIPASTVNEAPVATAYTPKSTPEISIAVKASTPKSSPSISTELVELGRFQIRDKLGEGAFGSVYRAYDPHLDREVALKVPHPGSMQSPKRVERFLREAKAAARLRHPHIVPVFDAGNEQGHYYIAAAFIKGRPLSDAVEDGGMEYQRAAHIVHHLAEAVAYAHEQGIVHRDIKPANVMLDKKDRPHLMDFGLAAKSDEAEKLTNDGAILGTPAYMAPEQAVGQKSEAKPASDEYALGVVLYELLTGKAPFEGPPAVVIFNVINKDPVKPSEFRPRISPDLETICLKAMAKLPEQRYPDCQALADDLRRWLDDEPISARRPGMFERGRRWIRKDKSTAVSIMAVGFTLTVAAVVSIVMSGRLAFLESQERKLREQADSQTLEAKDKEREALQLAKELQVALDDAKYHRGLSGKQIIDLNTALKNVEAEKKRANDAAKRADEAARLAESERKKADDALAILQDGLKTTDSVYHIQWKLKSASILRDAYKTLEQGGLDKARKLLESCPENLRTWEFNQLWKWSEGKKTASGFLNLNRNDLAKNIGAKSICSLRGDKLISGDKDLSGVVVSLAQPFEVISNPLTPSQFGTSETILAIRDDGQRIAVLYRGPGLRVAMGRFATKDAISVTDRVDDSLSVSGTFLPDDHTFVLAVRYSKGQSKLIFCSERKERDKWNDSTAEVLIPNTDDDGIINRDLKSLIVIPTSNNDTIYTVAHYWKDKSTAHAMIKLRCHSLFKGTIFETSGLEARVNSKYSGFLYARTKEGKLLIYKEPGKKKTFAVLNSTRQVIDRFELTDQQDLVAVSEDGTRLVVKDDHTTNPTIDILEVKSMRVMFSLPASDWEVMNPIVDPMYTGKKEPPTNLVILNYLILGNRKDGRVWVWK